MRALVPLGFWPSVTPGTRQVTVGGAIASDIHGKNHNRDGTFGGTVDARVLVTAGWGSLTLSPEGTPDELWASTGGMGLTGLIRPGHRLGLTAHRDGDHAGRQLSATPPDLAHHDGPHGRHGPRLSVQRGVDRLLGARVGPRTFDPRVRRARSPRRATAAPARPGTGPDVRPARLPRRPTVGPVGPPQPLERRRLQRALVPQIASSVARAPGVGGFVSSIPLDLVSGWNRIYGQPRLSSSGLSSSDPTVRSRPSGRSWRPSSSPGAPRSSPC